MGKEFISFLSELIITVPIILLALTFHEFAHGFIAYKLGDPTAKLCGRLTLNPLKHLDPIGTICMIFAHFGWARPVPIDISNFKNSKRDLALSALAGPVANLLLAFFGCFFFVIAKNNLPLVYKSEVVFTLAKMLYTFLFYFVWLNISLAIFNFLPIPPLDGSKILYAFLPPRANTWCKMHEREIGLIFMFVLIADSRFLGGMITGVLSSAVDAFFNLFTSIFDLFL